MVINSVFFIPAYAQYVYNNHGLSMVFPQSADNIPPIESSQNGIPTVYYGFTSPFSSPDSIETTDGSYISIQFFPPGTNPQNTIYLGRLCTEITPSRVPINTIESIKVHTVCNFGLTEPVSEYYLIPASSNLVVITYHADDQFTFDTHNREFISSLGTLQIR